MDKKVCVIVGVGPGVGLGVAKRFGREGYTIALLARNVEKLADLVKQLGEVGIEAHSYSVDVADFVALRQALATIRADLGDPEVLVYNSAALKMGVASSLDPDTFMAEFKVNVGGALVAAQAVIAAMRGQKHGTILLTGGGLSLNPNPQLPSLSIGKASVRSLAYSMGGELEPDGIQVATVTICGTVQSGTHFDPDTIAEKYWELHASSRNEREIVYK